jgi:hypothetical protein
LENEVEKLHRSLQDIAQNLQRQVTQVRHDKHLLVKQEASDFLHDMLSKPALNAALQQGIAHSPHLSQYIYGVVEDRIQQVASSFVQTEMQSLGSEVMSDLRKIADEINAECELRTRGDNDLNAALRQEVARVSAQVEATRIQLEEADTNARQSSAEELAELRNILDRVWSKTTSVKGASENYYFKFVDTGKGGEENASYKECVGDSEDINTLYEMVREALGTSVMMRKDLDEEKARREMQKTKIDQLQQTTMSLERNYQMLHGTLGINAS